MDGGASEPKPESSLTQDSILQSASRIADTTMALLSCCCCPLGVRCLSLSPLSAVDHRSRGVLELDLARRRSRVGQRRHTEFLPRVPAQVGHVLLLSAHALVCPALEWRIVWCGWSRLYLLPSARSRAVVSSQRHRARPSACPSTLKTARLLSLLALAVSGVSCPRSYRVLWVFFNIYPIRLAQFAYCSITLLDCSTAPCVCSVLPAPPCLLS